MTPREREVLRAIARALAANSDTGDMDALATSYPVGDHYDAASVRHRAAMLLVAVIEVSDTTGGSIAKTGKAG